jgi:hypothetical protein
VSKKNCSFGRWQGKLFKNSGYLYYSVYKLS